MIYTLVSEAVLGISKDIEINGKVRIKLEEGIQPVRFLDLRKGIPNINGTQVEIC
jgi:hypothetical protein